MDQEQDHNVEEQEPRVAAPNEPWQNLCHMLAEFHITEGDDKEKSARELLSKGTEVSLPEVLDTDGEKTPYRLFPRPCYTVINSCVKLLEKRLENEVNGGAPDPEEEKIELGAMCLADMLFSGTCTSPDGKFSIHWVRQNEGTITLNPHGRRVKQLASRLEKYRTARIELAKLNGLTVELPTLSCRKTVEQDIRSSFAQWKAIDPKKWDGQKPWEITDSLDSLKENLGYEAQGGFPSSGDGFEDHAEAMDEEIAQRAWMNLEPGLIGETLRYTEGQRGNVLARTPKAWLWNYAENPIDVAVDYVCTNAKPCLEEAHSLLAQALTNPKLAEAGTLALTLDSQNKNNPDSYWKIIKRISGHFPSARTSDPEQVLQKLDCARFTICLEMINRRLGVDPAEFQQIFQEKIHRILGDPKRRETVTRNELLLETVAETKTAKGKNWGQIEREVWLEHLQSSAVGAYENSIGMEHERKRLLGRLNHLFKTPREELAASKNSEETREIVAEKVHLVISSASDAFYSYLSGKTGQMTRRELRTKVYTLKAAAEAAGKTDLAAKLGETGKFITSISSQIKSGDWYTNKEGNKNAIYNFLATMLECPRMGPVEFPGSAEPEPKDPLDITCDFLRAIGTKAPMGGETIRENLESCKEYELADEGGQLTQALRKITKTRDRGRGEKLTLVGMISERKNTLEAAIQIAETGHESTDPVRELHRLIESEVEILRSPQTLDANQNKQFEKNLYFWKGLHYLAQNIQGRKEEERYQVSATGKGTLQNLVAMAKAKLRNKEIRGKDGSTLAQFGLTKTRERSLLANLAVPMGLWLERDEKGSKMKISHSDFMDSLKTRRDACELCLQISETDKEIESKTTEFEEKRRRAKNITNSYVLSEIIGTLEHPEELAQGLSWEMREPKAAALLTESQPEIDTPVKRWEEIEHAPKPVIKETELTLP